MIKKDWIDLAQYGEDYINGVRYFLDIAFTKGKVEGEEILCPCAKCCNGSWEKRDAVFDHLISKGFVKGYKDWIYHGEDISQMDLDSDIDGNVSFDDIDSSLFETSKDVAKVGGVHEGLNEDIKKSYKLVEDAISQLQGTIENEEGNLEAFQVLFGKEHPRMLCCCGRNITRTS